MSVWTIKPETVKYDLKFIDDDGNTHPFSITVKKRLTVGEKRRVMTAGWRGVRQERDEESDATKPEIQIDWRSQSFMRAETYITDWSLTDDAGKKFPIDRSTIESLDPRVWDLIEEALNRHVEAQEAAKKGDAGDGSDPNAAGPGSSK